MDLVRTFTSETIEHPLDIMIQGTSNEPLIRAQDICNLLEIKNMRTYLKGYDATEKQDRDDGTIYLTEKGLHKLLLKSRRIIAEPFQYWLCDALKDIRLQPTYVLRKQLNDLSTKFDLSLSQKVAQEKHRILVILQQALTSGQTDNHDQSTLEEERMNREHTESLLEFTEQALSNRDTALAAAALAKEMFAAENTDLEQQVADLQEKLDTAGKLLHAKDTELAALDHASTAMRTMNQFLEQQVSELSSSLDTMNREVATHMTHATKSNTRIADLEVALEKANQELSSQMEESNKLVHTHQEELEQITTELETLMDRLETQQYNHKIDVADLNKANKKLVQENEELITSRETMQMAHTELTTQWTEKLEVKNETIEKLHDTIIDTQKQSAEKLEEKTKTIKELHESIAETKKLPSKVRSPRLETSS